MHIFPKGKFGENYPQNYVMNFLLCKLEKKKKQKLKTNRETSTDYRFPNFQTISNIPLVTPFFY